MTGMMMVLSDDGAVGREREVWQRGQFLVEKDEFSFGYTGYTFW